MKILKVVRFMTYLDGSFAGSNGWSRDVRNLGIYKFSTPESCRIQRIERLLVFFSAIAIPFLIELIVDLVLDLDTTDQQQLRIFHLLRVLI